MCIASENGILAVQMGHVSKSDRGVCSFTPIGTVSAIPNISKQFNRLFLPQTLPIGQPPRSENHRPQLALRRARMRVERLLG